MYHYAVEKLREKGYNHYEVSNAARPGFECRHNRAYWLRGEYLGLGCAAHSLLDGCRFANPPGLEDYLAGRREQDRQRLTREDVMEEALMLSTRTTCGLDTARWRRDFGAPFERGREAALERLVRGGLVEMSGDFLRLTLRGMELHNAVVLELLEDMEA